MVQCSCRDSNAFVPFGTGTHAPWRSTCRNERGGSEFAHLCLPGFGFAIRQMGWMPVMIHVAFGAQTDGSLKTAAVRTSRQRWDDIDRDQGLGPADETEVNMLTFGSGKAFRIVMVRFIGEHPDASVWSVEQVHLNLGRPSPCSIRDCPFGLFI